MYSRNEKAPEGCKEKGGDEVMKMKRVIAAGLAGVMTLSLAACAGGSEEETEDGKIVISTMSTLNPDTADTDPIVKTWYESWDKFQEEHPEVKVESEYVPHDAYQDKAQILATGGELPDVFEMKGSWTSNWVDNGVVMSLDDMLEEDPEWASIINGGAYSAFTKNDSIYGLSVDGGGLTSLLFYNEDIFNECGITEFPKTLDEFSDAIVKIKEHGYTPIALGNVANWPAESCIFSFLMSRICGEEWIQNLLKYDGSADFTNPDFIKALEVLQEWAELGAFNSDVNSIDYTEARSYYYNGDTAMVIDGYWAVQSILADGTQDVIDATRVTEIPVEKREGDIEHFEGGGWAVSVNSEVEQDTEKLELIKEWYKEYFCEDTANTMYEMGKVPSIQSSGYDESKLEPLQVAYYDLYETTDQYTVIDLHFEPSLVDVLNTSLQELLIGQVTPEEIAQRVQTEYEKSL